jgi:hypothetical protein
MMFETEAEAGRHVQMQKNRASSSSIRHGSHRFVFFAPPVCSPFDRTYGPIDSFLAGLYDESIGYADANKQAASSSHALHGGEKSWA